MSLDNIWGTGKNTIVATNASSSTSQSLMTPQMEASSEVPPSEVNNIDFSTSIVPKANKVKGIKSTFISQYFTHIYSY